MVRVYASCGYLSVGGRRLVLCARTAWHTERVAGLAGAPTEFLEGRLAMEKGEGAGHMTRLSVCRFA